MKTSFCKNHQCSSIMYPKRYKGQYCSMSCKFAHQRILILEKYYTNPKLCQQCNMAIQYKRRENKFCSHSCSASFHNALRGPVSSEQKKKISAKMKKINEEKTKKFSSITGLEIIKGLELCFWDQPGKKSFIIKLSKIFNIKLGNPNTTLHELNQLKSKIENLYYNQRLSSLRIKKELNINLPDGHMPAFLKQLGIVMRSHKDATNNAIITETYSINTNPKYKNGWHIDWKGDRHFYRSSYELIIMKILDKKKKFYECENLRISYFDHQQNKVRFAVPDFVLNKMIIEVKSKFTYDMKNMNDKFNEYRKQGFKPILILEGKAYLTLPPDLRS